MISNENEDRYIKGQTVHKVERGDKMPNFFNTIYSVLKLSFGSASQSLWVQGITRIPKGLQAFVTRTPQ